MTIAAVPGRSPAPSEVAAAPLRDSLVEDLALSPNGKLLAYSVGRDVHVLTVDSGEVRLVSPPAGTIEHAVTGWYPDLSRLLLLRTPAPRPGEPRSAPAPLQELWSISLREDPPVLLHPGVSCAATALDGRLAVCIHGELVLLDPDGAARTLYSDTSKLRAAAWAPSGKHIAVLGFDEESGWSLMSVSVDDATSHVLVSGCFNFSRFTRFGRNGIAWLGRRVVFPWNDDKGVKLMAIPTDITGRRRGKAAEVATVQSKVVWALSASADGSRLVFGRGHTQNDVKILRIGGSDPGGLPTSNRDESVLGWSRDGRILYFDSLEEMGRRLYRHEIATGTTSLVRDVHGAIALTPDRSHLLEFRNTPGEQGQATSIALFQVPLDGGDGFRIGPYRAPFQDEVGLRCTKACVLAHSPGSGAIFESIDLVQGVAREVARVDADVWRQTGPFWALSQRGDRVALSLRHEVRLVDLVSRHVERITPRSPCLYRWLTWAPNDESLYATCIGTPSNGQLVRIGLDGAVDPIWSDKSSWLASPQVSPDGKHIAFNARTFSSRIWILDGL